MPCPTLHGDSLDTELESGGENSLFSSQERLCTVDNGSPDFTELYCFFRGFNTIKIK